MTKGTRRPSTSRQSPVTPTKGVSAERPPPNVRPVGNGPIAQRVRAISRRPNHMRDRRALRREWLAGRDLAVHGLGIATGVAVVDVDSSERADNHDRGKRLVSFSQGGAR